MTTTLEHPPLRQRSERAAQLVTGVLDIDRNGAGRLRGATCLPAPDDPQVPAALIRRHGLRKGDLVEGVPGERGGLTAVA
ncbi:transcription termination factor Rho, partial [Streptomyces sp. SID9944]|nr:transcription termination factor Rho [Streptomyces sp. SID9944]